MKKSFGFILAAPVVAALVVMVISTVTCDSGVGLGDIGLGKVVDVEKPAIVSELPSAGAYIKDAVAFSVKVTDDIGIDRVYMTLQDQSGKDVMGHPVGESAGVGRDVEVLAAPGRYGVDGTWVRMLDWDSWSRANGLSWATWSEEHQLAKGEKSSNYYFFDLDTIYYIGDQVDGNYVVKVMAIDQANRHVESTNLPYVVKNKDPAIELLIPKVKSNLDISLDRSVPSGGWLDPSLPTLIEDWDGDGYREEHVGLEVLNSGFLSGVATDREDVDIAGGYPMVKIWRDGDEEPGDEGWVAPASLSSDTNSTSVEFRYYMTEDGRETDDASKYLPTGYYRLRVKTKDVHDEDPVKERVRVYPPLKDAAGAAYEQVAVLNSEGTSYDQDSAAKGLRFYISAASVSPGVTLDNEGEFTALSKQLRQTAEGYYIEATVTHPVGISETLTNLNFTYNGETYRLPWDESKGSFVGWDSVERRYADGRASAGDFGEYVVIDEGTGEKGWKAKFVSKKINPGEGYEGLSPALGAFPETSYDFNVEAYSIRSERLVKTIANVTFDMTPPEDVQISFGSKDIITKVDANGDPVLNEDGTVDDTQYVNGKITVSFSASDTNGIKSVDGVRDIKYLISKEDYEGEKTAEELFDLAEGAGLDRAWYIDKPGERPDFVEFVGAKLRVNTQYEGVFDDGDWIYIYVIARDKAGNAAYAREVLRLDISSDVPVIKFTDSLSEVRGFADMESSPGAHDEYLSSAMFTPESAKIRGTLSDDDEIDRDSLYLYIAKEGDEEYLKTFWETYPDGLASTNGEYPADADPLLKEKVKVYKIVVGEGQSTYNIDSKTLGGLFDEVQIGEGGYYFSLSAGDTKGGDADLAAVINVNNGIDGNAPPYYFAVDAKDPVIKVNSPTSSDFVKPDHDWTMNIELTETTIAESTIRISEPYGGGGT